MFSLIVTLRMLSKAAQLMPGMGGGLALLLLVIIISLVVNDFIIS